MAGKLKEQLFCDILICGAGLAGLSLVYRALKSGKWNDQQIILIDPSEKVENDRTWSFWKEEHLEFDELIFKSWDKLFVFSNNGERIPLNSGSYTYNSIRSLDFYRHVLAFLSLKSNVRFIKEEVIGLHSEPSVCIAKTARYHIQSSYAYNSIFKKPLVTTKHQYFLQHFKGVVIRSSELSMQLNDGYLMDYRTPQTHGTTFFYTLPLSAETCFVEYTLFSKSLLIAEAYDEAIKNYIRDVLKLSTYEVEDTEFGVIPMTDFVFPRYEGRIVNIGTIGGDTRGATGYTFTNVQKTISAILAAWTPGKLTFPLKPTMHWKHRLYDSILLNVLDGQEYAGHRLFCDLFRNTAAHHVFRFLDAETSLLGDMHIILSLRPLPFLRGLGKVVKAKLFG